MPVVYANILGKWVLLNDEYNINGCPCDSFVVDYLDKENLYWEIVLKDKKWQPTIYIQP